MAQSRVIMRWAAVLTLVLSALTLAATRAPDVWAEETAQEQADALAFMKAQNALVQNDAATAVGLLQPMAERGHQLSQLLLGIIYESGSGVVPQDLAKAIHWFTELVRTGYTPGMVRLADMYREGRGLARNDAEAFALYRRASDGGNRAGYVGLGIMYAAGAGVARDPAEAARWFRLAAAEGEAAAQYGLAMLLEKGDGVPRDLVEAKRLYEAAAAQGHVAAKQALDNLASKAPVPGGSADAASSQYFVAVDGKPLGPLPIEEVKARIRSGATKRGDLVWKPGLSEWVKVEALKELSADLP